MSEPMLDHRRPALPERDARPPPVATLVNRAPWTQPNAHLLGYVEVVFFGGWNVRDIPIFKRSDGTLSAGMPSPRKLDRDGRIRLKADGKREHSAIISFTTDAARERWNSAIICVLADAGIALGVRSEDAL
jgi:hypothetical protein